jgi:hypothetical protein
MKCPSCGTESSETARFCRRCGYRLTEAPPDEAATRQLDSQSSQTQMMDPRATGPAYMPPLTPAAYPAPRPTTAGAGIDIGKWISDGWRIYKQDWFTFTLAAVVATFLSLITLCVTTGPFILGFYFMAFKAMRGERIQVSDVFKGFERFGLAFLTFIIEVFIHVSLGAPAESSPMMGLVSFAVSPLVFALFTFVYPLIQDRRLDIGSALNEAWKVVVSRNWLMFWVLGLVFTLLPFIGLLGCGVGFFVMLPVMLCASAAAYKDILGVRSMPSSSSEFDYWSGPRK